MVKHSEEDYFTSSLIVTSTAADSRSELHNSWTGMPYRVVSAAVTL